MMILIRAKIINGNNNEGVHELTRIDDTILWKYIPFKVMYMDSPILKIEHRGFIYACNSPYCIPFKESDLDNLNVKSKNN